MKKTYSIFTAICSVAIIAIHALPHAADPESTMNDAFFRSEFNYYVYTLFSNFYPDNFLAKDIPFLLLLTLPVIAIIAVVLRRSPLVPAFITALSHLYFVRVIYISGYVNRQSDMLGPGSKWSLILAAVLLLSPVLLLIKLKPRNKNSKTKAKQAAPAPAKGQPVSLIACPKCKADVALRPKCTKCGFDMKAFYAAKKMKPPVKIQCPGCSSIVPKRPLCTSCGFDMKTYYTTGGTGSPAAGRASAGSGTLMSIGELFSASLGVFKQRWVVLVLLTIIGGLTGVALFAVPMLIGTVLGAALGKAGAILMVIFTLMAVALAMAGSALGMASVTSAVVDRSLNVKDALSRGLKNLRQYLWVTLLAMTAIWGGYVLFVIPGILFTIWALNAQFIIFQEQERGIKALIKSRQYVGGQLLDTFLKLLVLALASGVIGAIPLVGLAAYPFMVIFMHQMYLNFRQVKGTGLSCPSDMKAKLIWAVPAVIGLFLPIAMVVSMGTSGVSLNAGGNGSFMARDNIGPVGEGKGKALMVINGQRLNYEISTGFFSDTRMSEPTNARLQFTLGGQQGADAIEMELDATKTGTHFVDGAAMEAGFMGEDTIRIGNETSGGYEAKMRWKAYGGQIFWPQGTCTIHITKPYSGATGSEFYGYIDACNFHSAGIDKNVSSFEFKVTGMPKE